MNNSTQKIDRLSIEDCMNSIKILLEAIKRKSHRIVMLLNEVERVLCICREKGNITQALMEFISVLDRFYECKGEERNQAEFGKVMAYSLEAIKIMGGKVLPGHVQERFDPKIHCCIAEIVVKGVAPGTILRMFSRAFQFGERIYPAQVIVAKEAQAVTEIKEEEGENHTVRKLCKSDVEYREFVIKSFLALQDIQSVKNWINVNFEKVMQVYELDFDSIRELLEKLYGEKDRGSEPFDPSAMIRSLLLMNQFWDYGVSAWVDELKTTPRLAILSGFSPAHTPSVGAYYKFFQKLENGPYVPKCEHYVPASVMRISKNTYRIEQTKPKEKPARGEDREGVVKKLVEKLKKEESEPIPSDLEQRLNEILTQVAVKHSAGLRLIEDIKKVTLAGDGSTLPTQASHCGHPTCDCHKQGIYHCCHPKKFVDTDAAWGWDNRIEDFVYGYRYYQLVSPEGNHDLPLYLTIAPCNTHEGVMGVSVLERIIKQNHALWPEFRIAYFTGDAIHDIYAFYDYLIDKKIRYAIPYANQPSCCNYLDGNKLAVNEDGVPLCPGGLPMRLHGKNKFGDRIYACPAKRPTHKDGKYIYVAHRDICPRGTFCQPESPLGPWATIKPADDPRICPAIPRDSKEFKDLQNLRTSCERSNSTKKEYYGMKYRKTRVMTYAFINLALISILEHSRAWVKENLIQHPLIL